jgi:hypothetical protein
MPKAQPSSRPRHDQDLLSPLFFVVFPPSWNPCRGHDSIPTRIPKVVFPPSFSRGNRFDAMSQRPDAETRAEGSSPADTAPVNPAEPEELTGKPLGRQAIRHIRPTGHAAASLRVGKNAIGRHPTVPPSGGICRTFFPKPSANLSDGSEDIRRRQQLVAPIGPVAETRRRGKFPLRGKRRSYWAGAGPGRTGRRAP